MIRLRLQRRGRRKRPYFHIVAADQRSPRDGRVIERLGRYDNVSENKQLTLDEERVIHWLRVGAQPSDTVRSLLKREGILYKLHLIRWGKSEEEIATALEEWKSNRSSDEEEATSRKEQQKSLLEAEAKEYKKQLEEKAAQAAREAEAARLEAEKAEAEAEKEAEADTAEETAEVETTDETTDEADKVETSSEETAEETKVDASEEPEEEEETKEEASTEPEEEPKVDAADEEKTEDASDDAGTSTADTVSTDMNANEAIDHIKNTPLDQLEGFVTDAEDRVTVQRAWESKKGEE